MDFLTFLATVLLAYAWPLAFLIAIVLFKRPVENLLSVITRIKWKDGEIEFGKQGLPQTPLLEINVSDTVSLGGTIRSSGLALGAPLVTQMDGNELRRYRPAGQYSYYQGEGQTPFPLRVS